MDYNQWTAALLGGLLVDNNRQKSDEWSEA